MFSVHHKFSVDESILEQVDGDEDGTKVSHVHYRHLMLAACKCSAHTNSGTEKTKKVNGTSCIFINRFVDVNTSQGRIGDAGRILSEDPRRARQPGRHEEAKKLSSCCLRAQ